MSEMSSGPWERVDMDFWGPTSSHTDLLIVIDEYSRYAIVEEVFSKTAIAINPVLHKILSIFGIPDKVKLDNGPTINSSEFDQISYFFAIKHQFITPYWPKGNGEAKRFLYTQH